VQVASSAVARTQSMPPRRRLTLFCSDEKNSILPGASNPSRPKAIFAYIGIRWDTDTNSFVNLPA
jgi:hypothetical protein